jgi:hypothetical protein
MQFVDYFKSPKSLTEDTKVYSETFAHNPLVYNSINIEANTLLTGTHIKKSLSDIFVISTVLG